MTIHSVLSEFIRRHELPDNYSRIAQQWFIPVIDRVFDYRTSTGQAMVIGINGSQGSGKSTLADLMVCVLQQVHGLNALSLSIDDFYLTRKERVLLEEVEDSDGSWRRYVNSQLRDHYPEQFSFVDIWMMLKAPSFNSVHGWRLEQEEKLRSNVISTESDSINHLMGGGAIACFIQHYQRITEHTLDTLPGKVHFLFELDEQRQIENFSMPVEIEC
jgi:pantothenate kinase-related protein Tda10